MTKGLRKGKLLVLIISLYWKKRFSREHTTNPKANVWARPDVTFWAVGYHNTLACKRISWDLGGMMF